MKKLIFIFSFIVLTVSLSAQLHYFLPRNNAVMSILDNKYWFEGDTIINNIRYTKVYRQICQSETECGELTYYAAVREDTVGEKIYCIQTYDGVERLLADFNVQVGDKITLCSYSITTYWGLLYGIESLDILEYEVRIDAVDSILINNQYRKRVNYNLSSYWNRSGSFVEGIGNMEQGLFFAFDYGLIDAREAPIFLCLHIDDILIYQRPYYDTCYMKDNGLGIKDINNYNFDIYPTLVKDKLYFKTNHNLSAYKIYDSQGKLCLSGVLCENTVDISTLYPGIYYIVSYNDKRVANTSKFIKH